MSLLDKIHWTPLPHDEYYRKVPGMKLGDFVNWRTGIRTFQIQEKTQEIHYETQKRLDILSKIIAISALVIASLQLYLNVAL